MTVYDLVIVQFAVILLMAIVIHNGYKYRKFLEKTNNRLHDDIAWWRNCYFQTLEDRNNDGDEWKSLK